MEIGRKLNGCMEVSPPAVEIGRKLNGCMEVSPPAVEIGRKLNGCMEVSPPAVEIGGVPSKRASARAEAGSAHPVYGWFDVTVQGRRQVLEWGGGGSERGIPFC